MKSFDKSKLKQVETEEKNPLPTAAVLKEELRPETLPDVSGVASFDSSKLKHVETQEKTVLPTEDGKEIYLILVASMLICFSFHLSEVPVTRAREKGQSLTLNPSLNAEC